METLPIVETAEVASMAHGQVAIYLFFILALSVFLGFELIAKVPSALHTPLMSGANAISGITIVGAITAAGLGQDKGTIILGTLAVIFASINVVGGYLVTDRMLGMFGKKDGK
jgi:NAD(P) transhydrogenase subunit alpha